MDRLQQILDHKRTEIERILPRKEELRRQALERNDFRPFGLTLDQGGYELGLIAEVKKASPSAGLIAEDFDPVLIARAYESAGAHAISVLTDEKFFKGHLDYLTAVRDAVSLPVLRKDFILDDVQIYEAVCAGADAVLLIVAALEQTQLEHLLGVARAVQLDVLVEVHSEEELERALDTDADIIGINNRNLATFDVDLETTIELSEDVSEGLILVSESGIRTGQDTKALVECGVNAILVGEALMRTPDVHELVDELIHPDTPQNDTASAWNEDEE